MFIRILIAALLSVPVYMAIDITSQIGTFVCVIALQILAGLKFEMFE
jgi:hypothetical protein